MAGEPIYIVTQVSPYRDGPAGVHGVLDQSAVALAELGSMAGLEPVRVGDVGELAPSALGRGGVLALFTIGETPWSGEQRAAITEAVRAGRAAVLGVHAATDSCGNWPGYVDLVGARFDGHPWTQEFEIDVVDRAHPATEHLPAIWRWRDEVYVFRDLRPDAHVLLRVREGQLDMGAEGAKRPECGFPLAWCFGEGSGRCFYTSLGHFPGAWETPTYLQHLAGGLAWLRATGG